MSTNSGDTWTPLDDAALSMATAVNALAVDWTQSPPVVFAGTDRGVFSARLTGTNPLSWVCMAGSEAFAVNDLRADHPPAAPERLTLTAATQSGVWEYTFDGSASLQPVYRFYNIATGAHFYTASSEERDHVLRTWPQFHYEGSAFVVASAGSPGTLPVYRFFNSQTGAHFYTASVEERDKVISQLPQFVYEGNVYNAFATSEPGTVKLYRFYGAHFYTTQDDERVAVDQYLPSFIDEGPVYSVYPATSQQ
jgi:hypothetical protein